jgi:transposase
MHAAGLVPALWAPAAAVRDVRALAAQRGRLIQQHAAAGATLEQLLHEYHARPPGHSRLAADRPDWWARLPLPAAAAQRARDALAAYNRATALLRELDQRLLAISEGEHWRGDIERLLVVAGMDRLSALVLLGVIGDAKRFAAAEQLVGYAGLAPHTQHRGAPSGRHELRATMLDVTERALRHSPEWQARFAELERRIGSGRAHLAIARKLLVQVWQVLAAPAQALGNSADEARERQVRPAA